MKSTLFYIILVLKNCTESSIFRTLWKTSRWVLENYDWQALLFSNILFGKLIHSENHEKYMKFESTLLLHYISKENAEPLTPLPLTVVLLVTFQS